MQVFTKRQWSALGLVLLLLMISIGLRVFRARTNVERIQGMRAELFAASARNLSPEERSAKLIELRNAQAKLTPAERNDLFAESRKRRDAELERYARMSRDEKLQFLDDRIDQMRAMQSSGLGRPTNGSRDSGGSFGGRGGASNSSDDDREHRRKLMLDATTPEQRALRDNFMRDFRTRLAQGGLPGLPWGPR
jgi:hypothetical protein